MEEFIHTFSATTHLFKNEKDNLTRAYCEDIFFDSNESKFVLHKYAENGLRIEIEFNSKNVILSNYNKLGGDYFENISC